MPTAVRSHAKINLGLGIGAPRPDGFHSLVTLYQTLALHDIVTVTARPAKSTSLRLTSNDGRVPRDNRNTAWKMVELALNALGLSAGVHIHIEKRLPVQGGLGAGSANAIAALVGLEAELGIGSDTARSPAGTAAPESGPATWDSRFTHDLGAPSPDLGTWDNLPPHAQWPAHRLRLAAQVGSDVPLFLIGGTTLGVDRGQEVYPLPDIEPTWCVLAAPSVGVSTPQAVRDWDALCIAQGLTAAASTVKLSELSRAYASAFAEVIPKGRQGVGSSGVLPKNQSHREDLAGPVESALVRTGISSWIQNDFERVVFPQQPSLAEFKRLLAAAGTPEAALHASLSGSGSALFGLYLTQGDAEAACERLRPAGVKTFLTRTLPRSEYWGQMLLQ